MGEIISSACNCIRDVRYPENNINNDFIKVWRKIFYKSLIKNHLCESISSSVVLDEKGLNVESTLKTKHHSIIHNSSYNV